MIDDLKLALRRLRSAPGFTASAVVMLALAIGANTSILTIADAVLFRPLPYRDPARIYLLRPVDAVTRAPSYSPISAATLAALDLRRLGFSGLGARGPTTMTTQVDGGEADWIETFAVGPGYLEVLGIRPARGRLFDERDAARGGDVALLSFDAWQRRFRADERMVGRVVRLGSASREIVGVLPAGFVFPAATLRFGYSITGHAEYVTPRTSAGSAVEPIVRLQPGISREQAQARLDAFAATQPSTPAAARTAFVLEEPKAVLFPVGRPVVGLLVAAALLVLLIGCVNLASMLLTTARRRERELGLYTALGATPLRLVRPVFFEAAVIGVAGALLAVVLTRLSFAALIRHVPPLAYGPVPVGLDLRVAAFALALGLAAGVLFAVMPAWRTAGVDVQALITGRPAPGRRGRGFYGSTTIAIQVALAVVLASGALVAARAFVSVLRLPLGFTSDRVLTLDVYPNGPPGRVDAREFYTRSVAALGGRAEVLAAGATSSMPLGFRPAGESVGGPAGARAVAVAVTPGFFETVGMRIVRGRTITADDRLEGVAMVASQSAARVLAPSGGPLGRTVTAENGRQLRIVGIVNDVLRTVDRPEPPPVYVLASEPGARMTIVARVRARDARVVADLRREVGALAPGSPVVALWWSDTIDGSDSFRNRRFQTLVLGTFAGLALALTSLGIFAVVANLVASRRRAMGIRLALGAAPSSLVILVIREALTPVAIGVLGGLGVSAWLRRIAEAQLFNVKTDDPVVFAAAVVTVGATAVLAAYLPAREIARIDPVVVPRAE